jgi:uncharacterized OsmC-like protein
MSDTNQLKHAFERNKKAVSIRPGLGKTTGKTKVSLSNGTTCTVEGSGWKFIADVGRESGGNNAGPGPGVLERAALGSCLAIGYATWAAIMDVPIEHLEIDVESDVDARGMLGIEDIPPGFTKMRYVVNIKSSAPEDKILEMLDKADRYSPVRDDFRRAIPIEREIKILSP